MHEASRFQVGFHCFAAAALAYAAACVRYGGTRLAVHALFHKDEEIAYQDIEAIYHEWVRTGGTRPKKKWCWRAAYRSGDEVRKSMIPLPQNPATPALKPLWDAIRAANTTARVNVISEPR